MFARLLRDMNDPLDYYRYGLGSIPNVLTEDYFTPHRMHMNIVRAPRGQTSVTPRTADYKNDANQFKVMLNVKHFRPEEIEVKTVDNCVVIHGKHEEHADEHGFVSREFTRRYQLPDDVEPQTVKSSLSQDGLLTISAPRKAIEPPKNERVVPIAIQQPAAVEEAQKRQQQLQKQQAAEHQQQSSEEQK